MCHSTFLASSLLPVMTSCLGHAAIFIYSLLNPALIMQLNCFPMSVRYWVVCFVSQNKFLCTSRKTFYLKMHLLPRWKKPQIIDSLSSQPCQWRSCALKSIFSTLTSFIYNFIRFVYFLSSMSQKLLLFQYDMSKILSVEKKPINAFRKKTCQ